MPTTQRRRPWLPLGAGVSGVVLAALLAPAEPVPLPIELRWVGAYLLFVVLPGWLLVTLLLPGRAGRPRRWLDTALLSVAAGYGLAILLGLALHTLFRPIAPWQIAAGGGLLVVGLAVAVWMAPRPTGVTYPAGATHPADATHPMDATHPPGAAPFPAPGAVGMQGPRGRLAGVWGVGDLLGPLLRTSWPVLLILAVAAPLRLADLGWSEFQGDEARVVLRAMAALQGADGALAAHRKVPGEILLAYLFAGSLGQIYEGVARLPYALSAVGAVLAFYSLARRLLGGPAALVAGLLLAVNGYFVAFGRILQYDSLAFFLGIAGLVCCWQFGRADAEPGPVSSTPDDSAGGASVSWAILGALLLSSAALVALGAIFLVPPALVLAWAGLLHHLRRRSWWALLAWGWPVLPGLLAALLVVGAPDPAAGPSGIMSYLGPRFGGERPYWNGAALLLSANHYLSTPYLGLMLLGGAVAVLLGLVGLARGMHGRGVVIRLAAAIVLAALTWGRPREALVLGVVLVLALVLRAPGHLLPMRVAVVWAAAPLFVHAFLIRVPGTHWREAFPGLILVLAALLVPVLAHRRLRPLVAGLVAVLVVGFGHFCWVTLVQRQPEYQIAYPASRHILDWSGRDGRGIGGVFGAVHHHGWKALGVMMANGAFPGGYTTNESPAIAAWYLRQQQGCEGALAYVFRAPKTPQDRNLAVPVRVPSGYETRGQLRVFGRSTLTIQVPPTDATRFGDIPAEAYEERFDRELASVWRPVGELYRADLGAAATRRACLARNQPSRGSV